MTSLHQRPPQPRGQLIVVAVVAMLVFSLATWRRDAKPAEVVGSDEVGGAPQQLSSNIASWNHSTDVSDPAQGPRPPPATSSTQASRNETPCSLNAPQDPLFTGSDEDAIAAINETRPLGLPGDTTWQPQTDILFDRTKPRTLADALTGQLASRGVEARILEPLGGNRDEVLEVVVDAMKGVGGARSPIDPANRSESQDLGNPFVSVCDFSDVVFAVLSDPVMWVARLDPLLRTWMRCPARAKLLFFDAANREATATLLSANATAATVLNASGASIVFLDTPDNVTLLASPNGAWKNLPIVEELASRFIDRSAGQESVGTQPSREPTLPLPRWFAIVDDDTFLIPTNTAMQLALLELDAVLLHQGQQQLTDKRMRPREAVEWLGRASATERLKLPPIYAGHTVLRCAECRTKAKQYLFAFGGNGVFLSPSAVATLARPVGGSDPSPLQSCAARYYAGAGDERLAGCLKDEGIVPTRLDGAGDGYLSVLTDGARLAVQPSAAPFSFHRIVRPALFDALWALQLSVCAGRGLGPDEVARSLQVGLTCNSGNATSSAARCFLPWAHVARFFLLPSNAACASSASKRHSSEGNSSFSTKSSHGSSSCWALQGTPAEWLPRQFDPKQIALDQYAAEMATNRRRRRRGQ